MIADKKKKKKKRKPISLHRSFDIVRSASPFTFSYEFKHLIDINYCILQNVFAQNLFRNQGKINKQEDHDGPISLT